MIRLFTHNDLDGIACEILLKVKYGSQNVHSTRCNYENINSRVTEFLEGNTNGYDELYITDISVNEEVATLINFYPLVLRPTLIDHHQSALWLNKYRWATVDTNNSATKLVSDSEIRIMDCNTTMSEFVSLVDDYDTWRWVDNNNKKAQDLNELLYSSYTNDFVDTMIHKICHEENVISDTEYQICNAISVINEMAVEKLIKGRHIKNGVATVFANSLQSQIGNTILNMDDSIEYVEIVDVNKAVVSLRSRVGEIDVSEIAKEFGGGGHPASSGYFNRKKVAQIVSNIHG